jgi:hypothetical protein
VGRIVLLRYFGKEVASIDFVDGVPLLSCEIRNPHGQIGLKIVENVVVLNDQFVWDFRIHGKKISLKYSDRIPFLTILLSRGTLCVENLTLIEDGFALSAKLNGISIRTLDKAGQSGGIKQMVQCQFDFTDTKGGTIFSVHGGRELADDACLPFSLVDPSDDRESMLESVFSKNTVRRLLSK